MRIGIAGLGKMGAAMALRLKDTGATIVVWNRSRDKAVAIGCPIAETPRALAEQVDVIVSMLFDGDAVAARTGYWKPISPASWSSR